MTSKSNTPPTRIRKNARGIIDETLESFVNNLRTRTEANWNNEWGHPYFWPWPDDFYREKVIRALCHTPGRQTDYAAQELLRFLLYAFGGARHRLTARLDNAFALHRWRWFFNADLERGTGLNARQAQRACARLEARGLIIKVVDHRLGYVPHYRPTDDLFRACSLATLYSNTDALLRCGYGPADIAFVRKQSSHAAAQHHDAFVALWQRFGAGPYPGRIDQFYTGFSALMDACGDEIEADEAA